jgi:hypothetical protein
MPMSEIINAIKSELSFDDFSAIPSFAHAIGLQPKMVAPRELSQDQLLDRVMTVISKKNAPPLYFEHYSSHRNSHAHMKIADMKYYMSLSANGMSYYRNQDFEQDPASVDPYFDHYRNLYSIPFDSFDASNANFINMDDNFMFPGVRYASNNFVVFELPPGMRHVSYQEQYRDSAGGTNYREFYIPVPWQVYIAHFSAEKRLISVQMYFSKTPLYHNQQALYCPPMFNFYSNGMLCRPFFESMEDYEKYPKTISGIIASAFDWVWNSGFNLDIVETMHEYIQSKNYMSLIDQVDKNLLPKLSEDINVLNSFYKYSHYGQGHIPISLNVFSSLFRIWQSVPFENILDVNWNPFCKHGHFFYQSFSDYCFDDLSKETADYIEQHGLNVVESEEDIPFHEDDEGNTYDDDSYITHDALFSSHSFRKYIFPKLYALESTFTRAIHILEKNSPYYSGAPSSAVKADASFNIAISNALNSYLTIPAQQLQVSQPEPEYTILDPVVPASDYDGPF